MTNQQSDPSSLSGSGLPPAGASGWQHVTVDVRPPGLVTVYLNAEPTEEHFRIIDAALDIGFAHTDCPNVYLEFGVDVASAVFHLWQQLIAQHGRLHTCGRVGILLPADTPIRHPGPSSDLGAEIMWFGPQEREQSWTWVTD